MITTGRVKGSRSGSTTCDMSVTENIMVGIISLCGTYVLSEGEVASHKIDQQASRKGERLVTTRFPQLCAGHVVTCVYLASPVGLRAHL